MENVQEWTLTKHSETKEFVYPNGEIREEHITLMEQEGWYEIGPKRRLKEGVRLTDKPSAEDYEWCATFGRTLI